MKLLSYEDLWGKKVEYRLKIKLECANQIVVDSELLLLFLASVDKSLKRFRKCISLQNYRTYTITVN